MPCHVQSVVAITLLETRREQNNIFIEFELRWKQNVGATGSCIEPHKSITKWANTVYGNAIMKQIQSPTQVFLKGMNIWHKMFYYSVKYLKIFRWATTDSTYIEQ